MPLAHAQIRAALAAQPLFEDKTWQLSPEAWPLTPEQVAQLEAIGAACFEFQQALETLYLRSASGKNLLRNKPLLAPWVADYLDRGKPAALVAHARLQLAQLDVVQPVRDFFAVTGDERDGGATVQQFHSGFDLVRADTDFCGQLGQDFLHVSGHIYWGKRASLP
jgi:hypothetical protein